MTTIKERIEVHCEIQEVPYGKVYRWAQDRVLIGCDCGEVIIAEKATATCPRCGANYTSIVRELVGRPPSQGEAYYPEHSGYHECLFSGLFSGLRAKNEINRLLDDFYGD